MTRAEPADAPKNGWTISTLFMHVQAEFAAQRSYQEAQLTDLRRLLDERYATQTKALDAAFSAASLGVATALQSAREASAKAEENAEKRFESFRAESSTQIRSVSEKQGDESARIADRLNELTTRMDLNQGQGAGSDKSKAQILTMGGVLIAAGGLIVRFLIP